MTWLSKKNKRLFLLKCNSFCFQSHRTEKTLSDNSLDGVLWSEIKANEHVNIQYVNASPCFPLPHWISHLSDVRVKPLKPKWKHKSYLFLGTFLFKMRIFTSADPVETCKRRYLFIYKRLESDDTPLAFRLSVDMRRQPRGPSAICSCCWPLVLACC